MDEDVFFRSDEPFNLTEDELYKLVDIAPYLQ